MAVAGKEVVMACTKVNVFISLASEDGVPRSKDGELASYGVCVDTPLLAYSPICGLSSHRS